MIDSIRTIGIIGAGKVGVVFAQLALKAGYKVNIAGSGDPKKIALSISVLAPGAAVMTSDEVGNQSDVIILAIPLGNYKGIPVKPLANKIVIDAMNYWREVDGERPDLKDPHISSSELVQLHLSQSRIVKAFNHIGYHDLYDEPKPTGSPGRKAIAVSGDNENDVSAISNVVNDFGFDPVAMNKLSDGIKLQPGSHVFGAHVGSNELRRLIDTFETSDWGREVLLATSS